MNICPNCNSELKSGIIRNNQLLDIYRIQIINEFAYGKSEAYCNKCGDDLLKAAKSKINLELSRLNNRLYSQSQNIPIITSHTPLGWEYNSQEIVTVQTTTGTGVFAEFTAQITDFWGVQSGTYNKKLAECEKNCFAQLRMKTVAIGGNAVMATDIDYSELGTSKGMLMVCASGTAIKLNNIKILVEQKSKELSKINEIIDE